MTPIPTRHKGVTYRSRLEARWAVVFARLGVDLAYEPEGFEADGRRYLPDFRIVGTRDFLAIKPERSIVSTADWERELDWQDTFGRQGLRLFILSGRPEPDRHVLIVDGGPIEYALCDCRRCKGVCYADEDGCWGEIGLHTCGDHDRPPLSDRRVRAAMEHAMAQKFGERTTEKGTGK